jgi:hypothetical protein
LPDDITICDNFIERALECFESSDMDVLNLMKDNRFVITEKINNLVERVYFQDLCIMYPKRILDYFRSLELLPNPRKESSGVAKQLNRHLRGFQICRVRETLVYHGNHKSKMNPKRKKAIIA